MLSLRRLSTAPTPDERAKRVRMVEAAGVELDRLSEYGLILKNASKSETLETVESLKILVRPPNCPQHNRSVAAGARLRGGKGARFSCAPSAGRAPRHVASR